MRGSEQRDTHTHSQADTQLPSNQTLVNFGARDEKTEFEKVPCYSVYVVIMYV
jgi:hypothetical protein